MADISKCKDIHCPSKEFCHRFTAPDGVLQSYADFHREEDAVNCDMFIFNDRCYYCNKLYGTHKVSCPTQKMQINL